MNSSRPAAHFEMLYRANPDPWGFNTSSYEQAKYRRTLAVLGQRRFTAGLEVGCSIGILTRMLAPHCDSLLGLDIVEDPLAAARSRCADLHQVRFQKMRVPDEWPTGRFDLIVFSEVLYFLSVADIDRSVDRVLGSVLPGATVVLVNWLGSTDDPTSGNDAADRWIQAASASFSMRHQERHEKYRLDVLQLAT